MLDQWSKIYCFAQEGDLLYDLLVGKLRFAIEKTHNTGAVFGIGQGGNIIFSLLSGMFLIIMIPFFTIYYLPHKGTTLGAIAAGLTYGGVIGNFIDRLWVMKVRDFILVAWDGHIWPVFNVADMCICAGVCYFSVMILFEKDPKVLAKVNESKAETSSATVLEKS